MKTSFERYSTPPDSLLADVAELLNILTLTEIDEHIYQAPSFDFVGPRIFGGQVLAQALMAASLTVSEDKYCHSLHSYFLQGGDVRFDVIYRVRSLRDGRSLAAREVVALQQIPTDDGDTKEQVIFSMMASFAPMEDGAQYQRKMPSYPTPESIRTEQQIKSDYLHKIPEALKARYLRPRHIEIRPIMPRDPVTPTPTEPQQALWLRIPDLQKQPLAVHQALLAFTSDYYLLTTALMSHGLSLITPNLQLASIDHSMHFHRPFDITDYLLYDMQSDTTSNSKGLNYGQFWQDGKLVASTQQEGLMRLFNPKEQVIIV